MKKWKTNIWSVDLGWKWKIHVTKNTCLHHSRYLFPSYDQKMRIGEFFKLVKIRIKIQVYDLRKKWTTNVWSLELGKKFVKLFFFQKTRVCARGSETFSNYNENMRKGKLFKFIRNTLGKTRFWSTKKVFVWNLDLSEKKWQDYFFTKKECLSWRRCTFSQLKPKNAQKTVLQVNQIKLNEKSPT